MAIHFDNVDDEHIYEDCISDLMEIAPYLAKGISDMFSKVEAMSDYTDACHEYDNLTFKVEGMLDGIVACRDTKLATVVRRIFKVLLWAEVE